MTKEHVDVSKCTPGPCTWGGISPASGEGKKYMNVAVVGGEYICSLEPSERADCNAQLIAEAFTVAHETKLSPRQLAEQRAELLEACKLALAVEESTTQGRERELRQGYVETLRAAIARATA